MEKYTIREKKSFSFLDFRPDPGLDYSNGSANTGFFTERIAPMKANYAALVVYLESSSAEKQTTPLQSRQRIVSTSFKGVILRTKLQS